MFSNMIYGYQIYISFFKLKKGMSSSFKRVKINFQYITKMGHNGHRSVSRSRNTTFVYQLHMRLLQLCVKNMVAQIYNVHLRVIALQQSRKKSPH